MGVVFDTADYLTAFPDLALYPGHVLFREPFTKASYKNWDKARRLLPKTDPRDVDNSPFLRSWRAAVTLVAEWQIEGVDFRRDVKRSDGEGVPLVLVSWLEEAAGLFLARRLDLKKVLGLSGNS